MCVCEREGGGRGGVWDLIDVFGVGCGFFSHSFGWGGGGVPSAKLNIFLNLFFNAASMQTAVYRRRFRRVGGVGKARGGGEVQTAG